VNFLSEWSPKTPDGRPLCKGFTLVAREQAKAYIYTQKLSDFGKLSPSEEPVVRQFGGTVGRLIKRTLKRWAEALKAKLERDGPYRQLRDTEHVQLIMDHLRRYHDSYEARFGEMEDSREGGQLGHIKNSTVYIRSTGYGVKVLMGLMMADRFHVVDRLLREERERVAYKQVLVSDLPDDSKNCPICQDPLDTATPESTSEPALKLIICCGQTIGENCLKAWLGRPDKGARKNCPTCRFPFPPSFLEKLFDGEKPCRSAEDEFDGEDMEDAIVVDDQRNVVDLVSPSPSLSPEPESAQVPAQAAAAIVDPGDMVRLVFMNPVHTNIPAGPEGLPNLAAAVSVGDAGAQRVDDFMMEG
jgi:Ring finger domain